ncbi:MAG TPA: hypothetical protein VGK81_13405, partial [Anaerolineae bacterium]
MNNDHSMTPVTESSALANAVTRVASLVPLPALLLKAFLAVEGAIPNSPDGVLQVTAGTRPAVISNIPRALKLAALGQNDDPALSEADLNARFAQAYVDMNLVVQVLTGAQYIQEQLNQFNGFVALAGLAYNAGPDKARSVIGDFGGDPLATALQYHKSIGTGVDQVTVQAGIPQTDPNNGKQWVRYPVIANDSGKEIFQYLYMRQVPGRNYGLLDFIYRPTLLSLLNLYQNDVAPGEDIHTQALLVVDGQFTHKAASSEKVYFKTAPLSQRDPQWKDITLGFGDASSTIGAYGCTLVCLTMVANGMGFDESPATLNDKLKALGPGNGYLGPLMVFSGLAAALPGIKFTNFVRCRDVPAPMADVDAALDAGNPVVVEVDYSPSPGLQNHWVLIYARQDGDYLIHDPWPIPVEASASLAQRYGFVGGPAQIITSALFYTGQNPNTRQPYLVVVDNNQDIADVGGLALRDAPLTGAVQTRIPSGVTLKVVEPISSALRKLGQFGQWLTVETSDGRIGSVAAWLVHAQPSALTIIASGEHELTLATPPSDAVSDPRLVGVVQPPLLDPGALTSIMVRVVDTTDVARAGGLALRSAPVHGAVKARLPAGTLLYVGEPAAQALQKVGKPNQWLNVAT